MASWAGGRGWSRGGRGPGRPRRRQWAGGSPSPRRRRPEAGAAAKPQPEPLPSGWRRHGVRGAAHRVSDPAACARAPAAPRACRRARRPRALPGREWGAGRGRGPSGPGVVTVSPALSSLSRCLAGLSVSRCLSLPPAMRLCACLSLQDCFGPLLLPSLGLCFSLSLSDPAVSVLCLSPYLSLSPGSVSLPLLPPPPSPPHLCV